MGLWWVADGGLGLRLMVDEGGFVHGVAHATVVMLLGYLVVLMRRKWVYNVASSIWMPTWVGLEIFIPSFKIHFRLARTNSRKWAP